MKREFSSFLNDIVNSIDKIKKYTAGMTFEDFEKDEKTLDAVSRNFTIIGEAVGNIPASIVTALNN